MNETLTPQMIADDPGRATTEATLKTGEVLTLRPLRRDDADRLARYFAGLSDQTRRWFAPHDFTADTARALCEAAGSDNTLRLVAETRSEQPWIVGYFILIFGVRDEDAQRFASHGTPLDADRDCTLAPSVADAYRGVGLAGAMMRHVADLARHAGRSRIVLFGGVDVPNARAVRFYEKAGFRRIAVFGPDGQKHDMLLDFQGHDFRSLP